MAEELTREGIRDLLPPRPTDGHKGTFGHVFIVGGSRGLTGAVKMAALAAARSGVGLVTAGVPRPLGDVIAGDTMEIMSHMLAPTNEESIALRAVEDALAFANSKDAVALGPGVGRHGDTVAFALEFIRKCGPPLVIDADALYALSTDLSVLTARVNSTIITPHPGEMARLIGKSTPEVQAEREKIAADFAKTHQCVTVLKGHRTVIAAPDGQVAINPTGNSGLATGGTGDVLTGLIAGMLAQGLEPFDAACVGTFVHGLAGDMAAAALTPRAMIAGDVIRYFPGAFRALETMG